MGLVTYYFRSLPQTHNYFINTSDNICPDVKKAMMAPPVNTPDIPKNTIKSARNSSATSFTYTTVHSPDNILSSGHLVLNIQKAILSSSVGMLTLHLYR